jgi:hypothetical protein
MAKVSIVFLKIRRIYKVWTNAKTQDHFPALFSRPVRDFPAGSKMAHFLPFFTIFQISSPG